MRGKTVVCNPRETFRFYIYHFIQDQICFRISNIHAQIGPIYLCLCRLEYINIKISKNKKDLILQKINRIVPYIYKCIH